MVEVNKEKFKQTMESTWALLFCSAICLVAGLLLPWPSRRKAAAGSGRLPPGPRGWPVVGNIFDLGSMPHQTLTGLEHKYGPLIWLRLGRINTLVLSSAQSAMEMFKNHDLSFSGRTINESLKACNFDQGSMSFSQYGPYWRMMRRLCTTELFVSNRIKETAPLRRKCVDNLIQWISDEAKKKSSVEVARFVYLMSFNLIGNLMLSRDLVDPNSTEGADFFHLTSEIIERAGQPNMADFFPSLRWLDPQGIRRKMERDLGRALVIAANFVKQRVQDQRSAQQNKEKDLLDVLLGFEGNKKDEADKISDENLNILICELLATGTETTNSTIEWAMTELLCNPGSMSKVRAELAQVVAQDRKVEESDIEYLHYLRAVVQETLRLHPPVPLLLPRRVVEDIEFMGYSIPKNTQVFVNVWAFGRDPVAWEEPLSFKPERFLGTDLDYRGQNFQFIPFGAGRRICPGIPLVHQVLHLVLGSLLHSFEWVFEDGVTSETMDMKEKLGVALRKAVPLRAIPRALAV